MDSKYNDKYLMLLRSKVGERFGAPISTPGDFELLSEAISESKAGFISTSTLKRLWGYVTDTRGKHISTLNILARYAGYPDGFRQLRQTYDSATACESGFNKSRVLDVLSLAPGQRVEIEWMPDRYACLRYLGDCIFEVEEARNGKLLKNSRVRCLRFIESDRLLLDVLDDSGKAAVLYEAGKINGIVWRLLSDD